MSAGVLVHELVTPHGIYAIGQDLDIVTSPNSMWAKMPANQLAKCAEAAAWRRAYPDDFGGLILEDAAHTLVDADPEPPVERKSERGDARQALREQLGVVDDESVAEAEAKTNVGGSAEPSQDSSKPESSQVTEPKITPTERKELFAAMDEGGVGQAAEGLAWINDTLGRGETNEIKSTADVPKAELQKLFDELAKSQGPAEDSAAAAGEQTAIGDEQ